VRLDEDVVELKADGATHRVRILHAQPHSRWRLEVDGVARTIVACRTPDDAWHLAERGASFVFAEPSARPNHRSSADPSRARAPVAGIVAQVLVRPGDRVEAGQPMLCVEAMKMEMWLNAQATGIVRAVHVREREPVAAGTLAVELEIGG
jgi:geranyl-CoA carboxylase alpha subunit